MYIEIMESTISGLFYLAHTYIKIQILKTLTIC